MNDRYLYNRILGYDFRLGKFIIKDPNQYFTDELKSDFTFNIVTGTWHAKSIAQARLHAKHADASARHALSQFYISERLPLYNDVTLHPKGLTPHDFQTRAARFFIQRNRSYGWLDPGLGKTIVSAMVNNHSPGRNLIVCPSFLKWNWKRELIKWSALGLEDKDVAIIESSTDAEEVDPRTPIIIFPDSLTDSVRAVSAIQKLRPDRLIVDEGQRFSNPFAIRTCAVFGGYRKQKGTNNWGKYTQGFSALAKQVITLSGTAAPNFSASELWAVLRSQCPGEIDFMGFRNFALKYCYVKRDLDDRESFYGFRNEDLLKQKLFGKYILRMTKEELNLPPKTREIVYLDGATMSEFGATFSRDTLINKTPTEIFRQIESEDGALGLGDIARFRRECGERKVKEAVKFIKDLLDSNPVEAFFVYAIHKSVIETLRTELYSYGVRVIDGDVKAKEKDQITQDFQDGQFRVVIGNIESCGVGGTFTRATRGIFVEADWVPTKNSQAEDRLHRIGQSETCFFYYLAVPNSLDEVILQNNFNKLDHESKFI